MLELAHSSSPIAALELLERLPAEPAADTPVLVAVHGISRNWDEHLEVFGRVLPRDWGLVVPVFGEEAFRRYQRLGIGDGALRADVALEQALEALAARTGIGLRRFHLFGFSGGAQFAHRFAMLHPERIRSLHLGASGHYTFFDDGTPWPRGTGRCPAGGRLRRNRAAFLGVPTTVYVGARDTERDASLRTGPRIDRQQGRTRVERARRWVDHLLALRHPADPVPQLRILPGAGHDFAEVIEAGLAEQVMLACRREGAGAPVQGA